MSEKTASLKDFYKWESYAPERIGEKGKVNWNAAIEWVRNNPSNADAIHAEIESQFLMEKGITVQRSSVVRKLDNEVAKGNVGKSLITTPHPDTNRSVTLAFYGPPKEGQEDIRKTLRQERTKRALQGIGAVSSETDEGLKSIPRVELSTVTIAPRAPREAPKEEMPEALEEPVEEAAKEAPKDAKRKGFGRRK